jgi:uncharacterized membrane protein YecN with MAPEG domain
MSVPMPAITALYAALQGLVMIGLLIPLGRLRSQTNVSLYDGGNPQLAAAIRRHANWTEYVPFALLLSCCSSSAAPRRGSCTGSASRCWRPASPTPSGSTRP